MVALKKINIDIDEEGIGSVREKVLAAVRETNDGKPMDAEEKAAVEEVISQIISGIVTKTMLSGLASLVRGSEFIHKNNVPGVTSGVIDGTVSMVMSIACSLTNILKEDVTPEDFVKGFTDNFMKMLQQSFDGALTLVPQRLATYQKHHDERVAQGEEPEHVHVYH